MAPTQRPTVPRLAQTAPATPTPSGSASPVGEVGATTDPVGPTDRTLYAPQSDECAWPVSYSGCASCGPLEDATEAEKAAFEQMAVDYLRAWTRGAVGTCPVRLRPCYTGCGDDGAYPSSFWGSGPYPSGGSTHSAAYVGPWMPALIGGKWYNLTCGSCGGPCDCGASVSVRLPGPIAAVDEIVIDGVVLDPGAYRVDNGNLLVRTDGGSWPQCQDMVAPVTEEGTWAVAYQRGTPVPVGGQVAAGVLACEFAKAACGDPTCGLPQRVQTVTRQGVTVALMDSFDDLNQGATGIWLIDSWVASVTRPLRGGSVRSVDVSPNRPKYRTQTWPSA